MRDSDKTDISHTLDPLDVAIYWMVHEYRCPTSGQKGAAPVAKAIRMKEGVLQNKVNPTMDGHELTVTQLRAAMLHTQDFRPLDVLNRDCGFFAVPMEAYQAAGDGSVLEQYLKIEMARGQVADAIHHGLEHKKLTRTDRNHIRESILRSRAAEEGLLAKLEEVAATP